MVAEGIKSCVLLGRNLDLRESSVELSWLIENYRVVRCSSKPFVPRAWLYFVRVSLVSAHLQARMYRPLEDGKRPKSLGCVKLASTTYLKISMTCNLSGVHLLVCSI